MFSFIIIVCCIVSKQCSIHVGTVSEKPEKKAEVPGLLSPDTSALILLCSIFDWTVSGKSVGRRHFCSSANENSPLVPPKTNHFPF